MDSGENKLERRSQQKQFKFLFTHNIETGEDLQKYQKGKEAGGMDHPA